MCVCVYLPRTAYQKHALYQQIEDFFGKWVHFGWSPQFQRTVRVVEVRIVGLIAMIRINKEVGNVLHLESPHKNSIVKKYEDECVCV